MAAQESTRRLSLDDVVVVKLRLEEVLEAAYKLRDISIIVFLSSDINEEREGLEIRDLAGVFQPRNDYGSKFHLSGQSVERLNQTIEKKNIDQFWLGFIASDIDIAIEQKIVQQGIHSL